MRIGKESFKNCASIDPKDIDNFNNTTYIDEEAFYGCVNIKEISIPETIIDIAPTAFNKCEIEKFTGNNHSTDENFLIVNKKLLSISKKIKETIEEYEIPEGVNEICPRVFEGCISLKKVKIPSTCNKIGGSAFYGCISLSEMHFVNNQIITFEDGAFQNAGNEDNIINVHIDNIDNWCQNIYKRHTMYGDTYSAIPSYKLFKDNKNIRDIVISDGVENINTYAFYNCVNLTSINIPKSVKFIGQDAFKKGLETSINTVYVNDLASYCNIEMNSTPFTYMAGTLRDVKNNNKSISTLEIPENVKIVGTGVFANTALEKIIIHENVETIKSKAFADCGSLKNVIFNDNSKLKTIENRAFYNNSQLNNIILPNSVETIGEYCFYNCGLKYVELSNNISILSESLFEKCSKLYEIKFRNPANITSINKKAFSDCIELHNLPLEEFINVENIEENAFLNMERIGTKYTGLKWDISETNGIINYELGYEDDYSFVIRNIIPNSKKLKTIKSLSFQFVSACHIIIPETVEVIEDNAFLNWRPNDKSRVLIPKSVTSIGDTSFLTPYGRLNNYIEGDCDYITNDRCFLIKDNKILLAGGKNNYRLNIPDGISEILTESFTNSNNMVINVPNSVKNIQSSAFANSSSAIINIGDGVEHILESAFYNCYNIRVLYLGNSIKEIGDHAFNMLGSNETRKVYIRCMSDIPCELKNNIWGDGPFNKDYTGNIILVVNSQESVNLYREKWENEYGYSFSDIIVAEKDNKDYTIDRDTLEYTISENNDKDYSTGGILLGEHNYITKVKIKNPNNLSYKMCNKSLANIRYMYDLTLAEGITEIPASFIPSYGSIVDNYIDKLTLPNSVKKISNNAFIYANRLIEITMGNNVEEIGDGAFSGGQGGFCNNLEKFNLSTSLKKVGDSAFAGEYTSNEFIGKRTITNLPESLEYIGSLAFADNNFSNIVLSENIKELGELSFRGLSNNEETDIYCKAITPPTMTVTMKGYLPFENWEKLQNIYVPSQSVEAYKAATGWNHYANYIKAMSE